MATNETVSKPSELYLAAYEVMCPRFGEDAALNGLFMTFLAAAARTGRLPEVAELLRGTLEKMPVLEREAAAVNAAFPIGRA